MNAEQLVSFYLTWMMVKGRYSPETLAAARNIVGVLIKIKVVYHVLS